MFICVFVDEGEAEARQAAGEVARLADGMGPPVPPVHGLARRGCCFLGVSVIIYRILHRKLFSRSILHALVRLLMVLLALLPVYGSWLDEDFAALQPYHGHIFLNGVKPDHHPSGVNHPGGHDEVDDEGVVNVPDQDAAGFGLVFLVFLCGALVVIPDGRNSLHTTFSAFYLLLRGIFPQPLEQPPRL